MIPTGRAEHPFVSTWPTRSDARIAVSQTFPSKGLGSASGWAGFIAEGV